MIARARVYRTLCGVWAFEVTDARPFTRVVGNRPTWREAMDAARRWFA